MHWNIIHYWNTLAQHLQTCFSYQTDLQKSSADLSGVHHLDLSEYSSSGSSSEFTWIRLFVRPSVCLYKVVTGLEGLYCEQYCRLWLLCVLQRLDLDLGLILDFLRSESGSRSDSGFFGKWIWISVWFWIFWGVNLDFGLVLDYTEWIWICLVLDFEEGI